MFQQGYFPPQPKKPTKPKRRLWVKLTVGALVVLAVIALVIMPRTGTIDPNYLASIGTAAIRIPATATPSPLDSFAATVQRKAAELGYGELPSLRGEYISTTDNFDTYYCRPDVGVQIIYTCDSATHRLLTIFLSFDPESFSTSTSLVYTACFAAAWDITLDSADLGTILNETLFKTSASVALGNSTEYRYLLNHTSYYSFYSSDTEVYVFAISNTTDNEVV